MIKSSILVLLFAICGIDCNGAITCSQKDVCDSYLDIAMDMIMRVKYNNCNNCSRNRMEEPKDCADVLKIGHNNSGMYLVWPVNRVTEGKSIFVYCDMETDGGGWTVIQRRGDFKKPKDYFYKDWRSYKEGFGSIEEDFWLGNDNIYALSNQKQYSARFDLKDVEQNKAYALYNKFWIDDEDHNYTLHITGYSGDAGDSMATHNNQKFSTKDNNDYRGKSCPEAYKGGWWYRRCHTANLNGLYHKGKHATYADGINWKTWKGYYESLEWTEIKIRPKAFPVYS